MTMCPRLARKGYYLGVLNEPAAAHLQRIAGADALTGEMYRLLVRLAERVRDNTVCTPAEMQVLNLILDRCSLVKLHMVPGEDDMIQRPAGDGPLRRATLQATIGGGPEASQGRRVYCEALVSLLEALEDGPVELCTCEECGAWYEPYSRAAVTRFCTPRCRNRYNYKARKGKGGRTVDQAEVAP
jgi:hypothetical protein